MEKHDDEKTTAPEGVEDKASQKNENVEETTEKNDTDSLLAQKKHWRDKAEKERKEREKLQKQIEEQQRKEAEEKEEFKTLYEQEQEKAKSLEAKLQEQAMRSAFNAAAQAEGCKDLEAAYLLLDKSQVSQDDDTVEGMPEAVAALKESKPYLFEEKKSNINNTEGTKAEPETATGVRQWKASELRELQKQGGITKEVMAEVDEAVRAGKFIKD